MARNELHHIASHLCISLGKQKKDLTLKHNSGQCIRSRNYRKANRHLTFSLLERVILVFSLSFILLRVVLAVELLTSAETVSRLPLHSSLVLFFFSGKSPRFPQLLSFERPLVLGVFLSSITGCWSGGSVFLSRWTCCRRRVSSLWNCFWMAKFGWETEFFCLEDEVCCGPTKPEWYIKI